VCGIVGWVGGRAAGGEAGFVAAVAHAMCDAIIHRGPDDEGMHRFDAGFIGMRRLAIIDLQSGRQPIFNETGTIAVVLNGEIYNYRELTRELEAAGHTFTTRSDTECIVHGYEQWGDGVAARLRGMFAFAIWDAPRRRLLAARDPLGKKPFFYHHAPDGALALASELKSLLAVPGLPRTPSAEAMRHFALLGYVPSPIAAFEGVRKLPPGHTLSWQDGRIGEKRYFQVEFAPKWQEDAATLEQRLFDLLDESVRLRLMSDVPFGAFLSGGLDSSVVVALMAKHLSQPVQCFTIGFEEDGFSEVEDARRVASHVGARHEVLTMRYDAVDLLPRLVWHLDEPFADASAIPTYLVSKLAAAHVKMVLTGDGGDEAFAGYARYGRYAAIDRLAPLRPALGHAVRALGCAVPGAPGHRMRALGERLRLAYPEDYLVGVGLCPPAQARRLLTAGIDEANPYGRVGSRLRGRGHLAGLDKVVAGDVDSYLTDDICVKVDRMSMANSLEARSPLLDRDLMSFAARLPLSLKRRHGRGKYLLRRIAARLLPPETLRKRKQGFGIPLAEWFRGSLAPMLGDVIGSTSFRDRGMFVVAEAQRLFAEHGSGAADHSEPLWLMLNYELWARAYADAPAAAVRGPGTA
jgi:asparagine synthase (glutamine-hydrolysing)